MMLSAKMAERREISYPFYNLVPGVASFEVSSVWESVRFWMTFLLLFKVFLDEYPNLVKTSINPSIHHKEILYFVAQLGVKLTRFPLNFATRTFRAIATFKSLI